MDGYRQGLLDYAEYIRDVGAKKEAETKEIIRRYENGEGFNKLAKEYGKAVETIKMYVKTSKEVKVDCTYYGDCNNRFNNKRWQCYSCTFNSKSDTSGKEG